MTSLPPFALAVLPIAPTLEADYRARMIERGETPLPEDGERCEWCGSEVDDDCTDECDCPPCSVSRALDDDADMWADR